MAGFGRGVLIAVMLMATSMVWAEGENASTTKPVESRVQSFAHAGVAVKLPKGFELQPLNEPFDVLRAVHKPRLGSPVTIHLSAYPVSEKATAEAFSDAMLSELRRSLVVRHLKVKRANKLKVAGEKALGRFISYTFRGDRYVAARVYFQREVQKQHICYLLTVETDEENKATLEKLFEELVDSVSLVDVKHPVDIGLSETGTSVVDEDRGYSLAVPTGWFASETLNGMKMGQLDYLLGGLEVPTFHVLVRDIPSSSTSKQCAKRDLNLARQKAEQRGLESEIISEEQEKLDGVQAYQFVLQQKSGRLQLPGKQKDSSKRITIVQRTVCVGDSRAPGKSYTLIMVGQGVDPKAAVSLFEKVADGFAFADPTTTQAGGKKEVTTAPAQTGG
ncbi:MAG: hypothetical protein ACLFVU_05155 [Phycisphaerae bacterium]